MHTVTVEHAASDLRTLIEKTIHDHDETVIASDAGAVVMIDEREWESIQETLRLFGDKRSLKALLAGHMDRDKGRVPESLGIEEAFRDLQD